METHILFFLATILAGTLNALAGGGGLITFPLLMLVVPPVTADATSAVALFFAYPTAVWRTRSQLSGVFGRGWLGSAAANSHGQSQLHAVGPVAGVGRHRYHHAAACSRPTQKR